MQFHFSFIRYPATLAVTLQGHIPDLNRSRSFSRPMSVLQEELTGDIYFENSGNILIDTAVEELPNMDKVDNASSAAGGMERKTVLDICVSV